MKSHKQPFIIIGGGLLALLAILWLGRRMQPGFVGGVTRNRSLALEVG
ncbi:MAG: hypothetical protein M2R45_03738 [Verrucomicrobia subdivision 3 bacterium]|nr:hypothetical protein [Limisphaerales bacterium]MCS1416939.1 hypothetical protein [Limisphaerales bacterium]